MTARAPGSGSGHGATAARAALSPRACTVLDGAPRIGDVWPEAGGALVVMERLKARFDPARVFRPGAFAGGL